MGKCAGKAGKELTAKGWLTHRREVSNCVASYRQHSCGEKSARRGITREAAETATPTQAARARSFQSVLR